LATGDRHALDKQILKLIGLYAIPIIAVTSYALDGEEKIAKAAGCDDYVPNPYGIPHRVLNIFVAQVGLQRAGVVASVRERITAGVAKRVYADCRR
jgi:CheY-like chemotaxis protein